MFVLDSTERAFVAGGYQRPAHRRPAHRRPAHREPAGTESRSDGRHCVPNRSASPAPPHRTRPAHRSGRRATEQQANGQACCSGFPPPKDRRPDCVCCRRGWGDRPLAGCAGRARWCTPQRHRVGQCSADATYRSPRVCRATGRHAVVDRPLGRRRWRSSSGRGSTGGPSRAPSAPARPATRLTLQRPERRRGLRDEVILVLTGA
jgi:hypothetical protein